MENKKTIIFGKVIVLSLIASFVFSPLYNSHAETINYQQNKNVEYDSYERTKQVLAISNNTNNNIERLNYCNNNNIPSVEQNISSALITKIDAQKTSSNVETSVNEISDKIDDIKEAEIQNNKIATYNANIDETFLLAAIIQCEAGNQSYEGKIAVGNVVLNRVNSNKFPDTIHEVIFQDNQFSPVKDGALKKVLDAGVVNESCMNAANDALNNVDIVGDCLFFHRTKGYDDGLILGDHVFY